jgi:hypothetical protein
MALGDPHDTRPTTTGFNWTKLGIAVAIAVVGIIIGEVLDPSIGHVPSTVLQVIFIVAAIGYYFYGDRFTGTRWMP